MLKLSKAFAFILAFFLIVPAVNAKNTSHSWYCKRNNKHEQPVLDSNFKFYEKYDLYWIDKANNNKKIYLTFDAGYENGNISKILDVLKEENVPGAFFVLGNLVKKNTDLIKRMLDEGHLVCNHTYNHKDMTRLNIEEFELELRSLSELLEEKTGCQIAKYYRPPEGKFNGDNLKWAQELGYKTIMWSFAYADWDNQKQPNYDYAKKKILDNVHNGEVMLLHPTSKTNANILKEVITSLKEQGYEFGTLDELCGN